MKRPDVRLTSCLKRAVAYYRMSSDALGVSIGHHPQVKHADLEALGIEAESFIEGGISEAGSLPVSRIRRIGAWAPAVAELRFLSEFERLTSHVEVGELVAV